MSHQFSIYDYIKPDYKGRLDEIDRLNAELKLENRILLEKCCNAEPVGKFRSCTEFWVECPVCGKRTKTYRKYYMAMQAWNKGEYQC